MEVIILLAHRPVQVGLAEGACKPPKHTDLAPRIDSQTCQKGQTHNASWETCHAPYRMERI